MAKIYLKFNEAVLKEIVLDRDSYTIGRKPDNDVVIDNPAVSGHHARIVKAGNDYVVEDVGSTNGTWVNEKKIDKRSLRDADKIVIGKHTIVFQDEGRPAAPPSPAPKAADADKTMILDTAKQRELLQADKTAASVITKAPEKLGVVQIVSGDTDKKEYVLTGRLAIVGSQDGATIQLKGWFAPKMAALISRRKDGYSISMSEDSKKITVNGQTIQGQHDLHDGDLIEVAGIKMYFYLKERTVPPS
jgi:pSer/pThr/pTyr-binding forkhead associated (FHA) protein